MQNITKFVLRRPVTTFLAILSLVFFGLVSLSNAKLELMSDITFPMMVVTTSYPGAAPEDVDKLITKPVEDVMSNLTDVKKIQSVSNENYSMVMVRYNYGTNMDKAYDNLKKKIDALKSSLPEDAGDPTVLEININDVPSIQLSVNNDAQPDLYSYVENEIQPQFEKIAAVASIAVSGGQSGYVKVELLPEKLHQYHLNMASILQAVKAADFSYPAGTTSVGDQKLSVTTGVSYQTVSELQNMPIQTASGDTIYLKDIAVVKSALNDKSSVSRYNGSDTISLSLTKSQKASAIKLSKKVKQEIGILQKEDPNLKITMVQDAADTIRDSLSSVMQTMVMAVLISMLIIFLFFGDLKASLIVGTSIPIAILGALIFMTAMGYSLNLITLSALVLGVGMMVDNSIVVLEACFRAMDRYAGADGRTRREAAMDAVRVVGMSVLGSTLTTCVVFLPLGLMQGLVGQFFKPLGFTIVFCMAASFLSAITIVPLCYAMYSPRENRKAPAYHAVRRMQGMYREIVTRLLRHKALVMITSVLLLLFSFGIATQIHTELMPATDAGIVSIRVETKPGLKIEGVDRILTEIEEEVSKDPDTSRYLVSSGASNSIYESGGTSVTVYLKGKRSMPTKEKVRYYKRLFSGMTDAELTIESQSVVSGGSSGNSSDYEVILSSPSYGKLKDASDALVRELRQQSVLTSVHSDIENAAPLLKIQADPIKAAAEGLSPAQIGQTVNMMLSGAEAMKMEVNGQNVSVKVQYPEDEVDTLQKVKDIMLQTQTGRSVKLSNVADIVYADSPSSISREDRKYTATITSSFTDSADSRTKKTLNETVVAKYLNNDVSLGVDSQTQSMNEEFGSLGQTILIAIFLVFVVMAAQFESMRFSFMVMTTIPFSLIGAFGLLWLGDATLSMNSLLGFLMLVGTVVNNGILYVDTVNQYREEMPLNRALVEAGATRLRPILMTTLTTVLSMVPMAMAFGQNGKSMQGLALVDVGGLLASTVLSLLMLPSYYVLIDKKKRGYQKNIPSAGYMAGKDVKSAYNKALEEERRRRAVLEYTEGESPD